jgi:hypothetical protein
MAMIIAPKASSPSSTSTGSVIEKIEGRQERPAGGDQ